VHIADNILYSRLNSFKGKRISSSLKRPDGLWGPFSLVINMHLGIKRPGPEPDHSPPKNTDAKNLRNYISAFQDVPSACLLLHKRQRQILLLPIYLFTFYLSACIQRQTVNDQIKMKRKKNRRRQLQLNLKYYPGI
jgi:hypothetical protein